MSAPRQLAERVKDSTTTTGTGDVTLSGTAPTGYQTFNAAYGTGVYFDYCIVAGSEWEVGEGRLSASTTLVRDRVRASSNAGALVSFSAGTKDVFTPQTADVANNVASLGRGYAHARGDYMP